jgi:hypothetical protein
MEVRLVVNLMELMVSQVDFLAGSLADSLVLQVVKTLPGLVEMPRQ